MGKAGDVFRSLRHSPDPRLRSFIVNWLSPLGADPKILGAELDRIDPKAKPTPAQGQQLMDAVLFHAETSQRRALILSLGTYGMERFSHGERGPLTGKLLDLYRNDPDAGIHGAAAWTLRQWGQQQKLQDAHTELMKLEHQFDRRWFVNSQGQTYTVIEGSVVYYMGSPPTETERLPDELLHPCTIPRRFALAATEVTVEQYQAFVKENPVNDFAVNDRYSPDPKGPMNQVNWYHAAAYCNWLSRREKLSECYEPNERGQYAEGMKIRADALRRNGYRLPTEAEWEYGCRAGTNTTRPYGTSLVLLGCYARYIFTSKDRAWHCGSLQPNDLGLFDTLGNVFEWCQDRYLTSRENGMSMTTDSFDILEILDARKPRVLRGGSFPDRPVYIRSALRLGKEPFSPVNNAGFRPARTLP
jgi:formylglycine-generating enzyme required for sulfatase activity